MEVLPNDVPGFIQRHVLNDKECTDIIACAEQSGFKNKFQGPMFAGDRLRSTFTSEALAEDIWHKIAPHCQPHVHDTRQCSFLGKAVPFGRYQPIGINPFMRISKYTPGKSFTLHRDTAYSRGQNYVAMHTLLLYLNDDFTGGETIVYDHTENGCNVKPETGKVLVFYHYTPHAGARIKAGTKYVLRTEVMFSHMN